MIEQLEATAATNSPPRRAMVVELRREAEDIISVFFEAADGSELPPWTPGAHIDVHLPNGRTRQYSLVPHDRGASTYRVSVLREVASRGASEYIHAFLRIGQVVAVTGPRNHFDLVESPRYLFIAGGIGITPLMSMIDAVNASGKDWSLLYGSRTRRHFSFLDRLRTHGDRVTLMPHDETGNMPFATLLKQESADTTIYSCGPAPMLDALKEETDREGLRLYVERFAPTVKTNLGNRDHELVCARSNVVVPVSAQQSFLSALQDAGVAVPSSCADGVCGTCEVHVLEGTPDHRDDILSEEAAAKGNRMFVCVSRALTERIVIDV